MPFYQEDRRYGSDARYGLSATTRIPGLFTTGRRGRAPVDDDIDYQALRDMVDTSYPNAPDDVRQRVYEQLVGEQERAISYGYGRGRGRRLSPYAQEREQRAEERFKEHEEDRQEKKQLAKERKQERADKRLETTITRTQNKVDRYEREIDRLYKEQANVGTSDERKTTIAKRLARLQGELKQSEELLDTTEKKYRLQSLLNEKGGTEDDVIAELKQRSKNASPEELAQLQARADDLGLKTDIGTQKVPNPFGKASPRQNMEALRDPETTGAFTSFMANNPQLGNAGAGAAPPVNPYQAEIDQLREAGGFPTSHRPLMSWQDVDEAGTNLGNIGRHMAQSAQTAYDDPSKFGESFLYGDFPAEAKKTRENEDAFIQSIADRDKDTNFFLRGWDRPLEAVQAVGSRIDRLLGGYPGTFFHRIGHGVEENTGSHTAGQLAEIAAPFMIGIPGFRGRTPAAAPEIAGQLRGPGAYLPPAVIEGGPRGGGAPGGGGLPVPSGPRFTPGAPEPTPAMFRGAEGPQQYGPYEYAAGPNTPRPSPPPAGQLAIERYREPYAHNPPRGGFGGVGPRGQRNPKFPEPFDPMAGPIKRRSFENETPQGYAGHPAYPRTNTIYGEPFRPAGLLEGPRPSSPAPASASPAFDAYIAKLKALRENRGLPPERGGARDWDRGRLSSKARKERSFKEDKARREGIKKSTTDKKTRPRYEDETELR